MPYLLVLLSLFVITGCSVKTTPVNLDYNHIEIPSNIKVIDNRVIKEIIIKNIYNSGVLTYLFFEETPKISTVLESNIATNIRNSSNIIEVRIQYLDLMNKFGFGKNDDLYCNIQSSLKTYNKERILLDKVIQTNSFDNTNISPFADAPAKVILNKCLKQHSIDITNEINNIN